MASLKFLLTLAVMVSVLLLGPGFSYSQEKELQVQVFLTKKQALEIAFPGADKVEREKKWLTDEQKTAISNKVVLDMIAAGGNIYYLAKFAGIFGLGVQDVGAQQTGMSVDDFKEMLVKQED